ncbi:28S ribosomal protein S29, mitochondrial isoform X2 [Belonocnema kinseyi]|uniref:28S ribosomal protein S29, mitochondrial isoform X2 n=1 Tax=Belonocnema kinseyi TaxID=2817044 RepID=UPI00143DD767|nr:28S ribosomal protein S29, mitochondrial isoform X2 [Belonocnema kinseyi]
MAFCVVLRRVSSNSIRKLSTVVEPVRFNEEPLQIFRTSESNPANHTKEHLKRFYTIPPEEKQRLFQSGGFKKSFEVDIKTFAECAIMVRQPALEIISYLRQSNYTKPINKYVVYGEHGCGKTVTLAHLLHYGLNTQHVLIHVPWVQNWFKYPKEYSNSLIREGLMDLPIDAATWLAQFRFQNKNLLPGLDITVSKHYTWSQRESTAKGSPIVDMVDFGINRIKFASEVIMTLMAELKQASIAGKCKMMVVIDGYNAFFANHTRIKNEQKKFVPANQVTLTHAFLDITRSDWNNGTVIVSVDKIAVKEPKESKLPRYLLQKEGFEHLDPFLPISVGNYDNEEFEMIIEYYKDRKWLRDISPDGVREVQLLTAGNPLKITEFCAGL